MNILIKAVELAAAAVIISRRAPDETQPVFELPFAAAFSEAEIRSLAMIVAAGRDGLGASGLGQINRLQSAKLITVKAGGRYRQTVTATLKGCEFLAYWLDLEIARGKHD